MSAVPHRSILSDLPHAHDELMSIKEVAVVVRVPEATLRYWRHLGSGPPASASVDRSGTGTPTSRYGWKRRPLIRSPAAEGAAASWLCDDEPNPASCRRHPTSNVLAGGPTKGGRCLAPEAS